jgi:uncharacterized membrane protein YeiB
MSFWDRFESTRDGIEDTVEFTIRMAVVTLACVVLVVVAALVIGLFMPNHIVDSDKVFEIVGPAFNMVIGAFVGIVITLLERRRDGATFARLSELGRSSLSVYVLQNILCSALFYRWGFALAPLSSLQTALAWIALSATLTLLGFAFENKILIDKLSAKR